MVVNKAAPSRTFPKEGSRVHNGRRMMKDGLETNQGLGQQRGRDAHATGAPSASGGAPHPSVPLAKILLVDDRPENLIALEAILEPLGHDLVRAYSGPEALKQLLRHEFAVILLDVQMPGMDGFETAAIIKQRFRSRHVPIVFITAINKDEQHAFKGYSTGAVDYIAKPIHPDILRSKVAVFVDLFLKGEQIKLQAQMLRENERREKERELAELERELERRHTVELAASEARLSRFKTTLDATLDGVFIFEPESLRFSYVNQGALTQLGYAHDELLAMTPPAILPDFDEASFRDLLQPLLDGRHQLLTYETVHRHRSGALIPVESFVQFIAQPGEAGRFVAIARDITERKRAEDALILAKEEAESSNRAKSEFISSVSHELRTPLNAIIGFSKLLLNPRLGPLNSEQDIFVRDIVHSGEHLLQLINEILDLSKIEAGKLTLDLKPVAVAELMEGCLSVMREKARQQELSLELDIDLAARDLPPVMADERRLKQIVLNLLSNALKFTPEGGAIVVSVGCEALGQEEGRLIISVVDNGIGIAHEDQERIFRAFEQVENSYDKQQQGTGLGLVLTRRMVELHGGRITVASTPGEGSTFTFTIPLCFAENPISSNPISSTNGHVATETKSAPAATKSHLGVDAQGGTRPRRSHPAKVAVAAARETQMAEGGSR